MRIFPTAVAPSPSVWSAQLTQTIVQVASHRSSTPDRPVEPVRAVQQRMSAPRVGPHILDIRV